MDNKRRGSVKRTLRNNRGETLVETIVSFVIVLIALAAVTSMIRSSTAMNVRAQENSDKIEAAATKVEQSAGTDVGTGAMTLNFGGSEVKIDLTVKTAEPFTYFEAAKTK